MPDTSWNCEACNKRNPPYTEICVHCNTPSPGYKTVSNTPQPPAPNADQKEKISAFPFLAFGLQVIGNLFLLPIIAATQSNPHVPFGQWLSFTILLPLNIAASAFVVSSGLKAISFVSIIISAFGILVLLSNFTS